MNKYKDVTVINVETTGVDFSKSEIIALGLGHCENRSKVNYYGADAEITPEVSMYTEILPSTVEGLGLFGNPNIDTPYVVAHNAPFHVSMINRYGDFIGEDKKIICTLRMARKLTTMGFNIDNLALDYVKYYLDAQVSREDIPNRTENNNVTTGHIFVKMCKILVELGEISAMDDLEDIYEWTVEPIIIETMPFGKHAGKKFIDIPMDYWRWALSNLDSLQEDNPKYDADLAASIAIALEAII